MNELLGYVAYAFILSTGAVQLVSMLFGRNVLYSRWSALTIWIGLGILQFVLVKDGDAPRYVLYGNLVSFIVNSGNLGVVLHEAWESRSFKPIEGAGYVSMTMGDDTENPAHAPQTTTYQTIQHSHPYYGLRSPDGPYWEYDETCRACNPETGDVIAEVNPAGGLKLVVHTVPVDASRLDITVTQPDDMLLSEFREV